MPAGIARRGVVKLQPPEARRQEAVQLGSVRPIVALDVALYRQVVGGTEA